MSKLWVYDEEVYPNYFLCSFMAYKDGEVKSFVIDSSNNDRKELVEFIKDKILVGYNSLTYDNILLNHIVRHEMTSKELYYVSQRIINGQNIPDFNIYQEFKGYMNTDLYESIDLMRMLFSKKLRVSLKELECSLNHHNVQELPYPFDVELNEEQKQKVKEYNINDLEATLLVLKKSLDALKLRRWMKKTYDIDAFSMDGVNGGVKILELLYEKEVGNRAFTKERTFRDWVNMEDIILPIVEFETDSFKNVLNAYKRHTWYSNHYDERLFRDNKFKVEPNINGIGFKFSLGGMHTATQSRIWESNDEYEILSIDVASYYPALILEWGFTPGHLNKEAFLGVYRRVRDERLEAKALKDKVKDSTLKLSINGTYGMLGNKYSWLFDHRARLSICVNGQLLLAMLIEKLFLEDIQLIDGNTDGIFIYIHKSKKERFNEIVAEWENKTKMQMEVTKFEKIWFLNTADYFATYLKDGKLATKEKGLFLSEVQIGKGMEFPIIPIAIKKYFLKGVPFEETIYKHKDILDYCTYKKLKRSFKCFHNNEEIQRVNRFYACKSGAYLYKQKWDEKKARYQTDHLLKDSPVIVYNKFDNKDIKERNINYPFYIQKAREIVFAMEGNINQMSLF